ncbi:MAG: diguanylate cyclase, partial [Gammaproteobacteria bacterium]|nr:diguanylate cyclase [Gammaproteobacteria bacterium]
MQLRNRLLTYFISLVVVILIVFGLSAYQVTRDSTIKKDKDLLESLVRIEADEIAEEFQKSQSLEHLVSHFTGQRSDEHIWLLIDKNYQAINLEESSTDLISNLLKFSFQELVSNTDNAGIITFNNKDYIWAKSLLAGTGYTAVHIYSPIYNATDYFARLVTRLVIVGIIILWIAVWVSLVISTVITRRIKEQQKKIEYQSSHDAVTGLQNRSFLTKKVEDIIEMKAITSLAVIIVGIDRFREINDTLGHEFGDRLLKEFGRRLKEEFWSNDTIARFGSDEYALLVPLSDHSHWEIVVYKIEKILNTPFLIQDIQLVTDVSIGISTFPDDGDTAAKLMKNAEIAMSMAKKSGSFYECYDKDKDPNSVERLQLISELGYAIERGEFELYFQPKINIHKHELVSCEALLRWKNPDRGMVPPDIFIPLAEQGSSIKSLTEWVLEEAIKQCANWHKTNRKISVAVNLSARLLIESELIAMVSRVLSKYELEAEYLILEITESA